MSTSRPWRAPLRTALTVAAAGALVLVGAGVAAAHVSVQPGTAEKGGYSKVAFRVPNESPTAGTIKLEVTLPTEHPLTSVRTTPIPGWTATVTKAPLNPPVEDHGTTISEAPRTITWTAQPGNRIGPNEFIDFDVSVGPLPEDADQISFTAAQTYDDGKVVNWDQVQAPGAEEPEHPAPTLKLVEGSGGGHHDAAAAAHGSAGAAATPGSAPDAAHSHAGGGAGVDNTARWLGGIGLVLGALGLGLGGGAVLRSRRTGRSS